MNELNEREKQEMFDALRILRDAVNVRVVVASDILELVSCKLNQKNGNHQHQRPPHNQQWQKRHNEPRAPLEQKQQHMTMIRIECRFCHGLGFRSSESCPVCKGAKQVAVPRDSVECGYCHGLGFRDSNPCTACNGTCRVVVQNYH